LVTARRGTSGKEAIGPWQEGLESPQYNNATATIWWFYDHAVEDGGETKRALLRITDGRVYKVDLFGYGKPGERPAGPPGGGLVPAGRR
jgi:hypothetical protein